MKKLIISFVILSFIVSPFSISKPVSSINPFQETCPGCVEDWD